MDVPMEEEGEAAEAASHLLQLAITDGEREAADLGSLLKGATIVASNPSMDVELVNPGRVRRHGDPMDLVHLAESVMKADQFVCATTGGKLMVIVDQIRALQEKAREILVTVKRDAQLHHAACNFTKVPGHVYHLYEKPDETCYFSMLSPREWGCKCPHQHLGSYQLEYDHSWTPSEQIEARSKDIQAINRVIEAHALSSIQYHHNTYS